MNQIQVVRRIRGRILTIATCSDSMAGMDRETLTDAINEGPVQVTMNNGSTFVIPSPEFVIVDQTAAHVLTKVDGGKYRARILALVCMVSIEKLESAA